MARRKLTPDPMAEAQKPMTVAQARALQERLKREFGGVMNGEHDSVPSGWEADANSAIDHLERHHLAGDDSGAGGRKAGGARSPKTSGARPGGTRSGARATGRRGRSRSRAGRVGSRMPGYSAGGPVVVSILYGTLALVVLYVLVRAAEVLPKGKSPIDLFAGGLQSGLAVLIAPVDPLAPRATRHDGAVKNSADVRQVLLDGHPTAAVAAPRAAAPPAFRRPTQTTTPKGPQP